jgi:Ca2+/Na+ antiporter
LLSVKASKKWDIDASLSNAVWSNIFDICIGLWVPIMIGIWIMWLNPKVDFSTQIPIFWFLIFSVIVYFLVLNIKNLNKKYSFVLLTLYLVFVGYLVYISV